MGRVRSKVLFVQGFSCARSSKTFESRTNRQTDSWLALFGKGQVRTGQNKLGQVWTGRDGVEQVLAGLIRSRPVRTVLDRLGQDRTGQDWLR